MYRGVATDKDRCIKLAEKILQQGDLAAGIEAYEIIINDYPSDLTLINTLGDLCARAGRISEAIKYFHSVAEGFREGGFASRAIAVYKKIYKLAPDNQDAYKKVAELYANQGLLSEARQWYLALIEIYKKSGSIRRAVETYERIARLKPDDPGTWLTLAHNYLEMSVYSGAHEAFMQAGRALVKSKRYDEAIDALQNACQLKPDAKLSLRLLVDTMIECGKRQEAIVQLTDVLSKNRNDIDLLVMLGRVYLDADMLAEAEEIYGRLVNLDATRHDYLLEVVRRYIDRAEFVRALAIIEQCADKFATTKQAEKAVNAVKSVLVCESDNLRALKCLAAIHRSRKDRFNLVIVLNCIVDAALEKGREQDAAEALKELIVVDNDEQIYVRRLAQLNGHGNAHAADRSCPQIKASLVYDLAVSIADDDASLRDKGIEQIFFDGVPANGCEIDLSQVDIFNTDNRCGDGSSAESAAAVRADSFRGRLFDLVVSREWARAQRYRLPISLAMVRINFSDQHGTLDERLSCAADLITSELSRPGDYTAIVDGTIMALMPGANVKGAIAKAECFCTRIDAMFYRAGHQFTLHCGISALVPPPSSSGAILRDAAGQALDEAIRSGARLIVRDEEKDYEKRA